MLRSVVCKSTFNIGQKNLVMQDTTMLSDLRLLHKAWLITIVPKRCGCALEMCTWSACISFFSSSSKNLMSPLRLRRMKELISRASSKFSWSCNSARLTCQPGLVAACILKACLIAWHLQQHAQMLCSKNQPTHCYHVENLQTAGAVQAVCGSFVEAAAAEKVSLTPTKSHGHPKALQRS